MAEFRVAISPAALMDIDRISEFHLVMSGPSYAEGITDEILDTLGMLSSFPYMGALHPDEELARLQYRKVICGNYLAVYKVFEGFVYIYRVVDGRMDYPKLLK